MKSNKSSNSNQNSWDENEFSEELHREPIKSINIQNMSIKVINEIAPNQNK